MNDTRRTLAWTIDVDDDRIATVRLSCGHVKVVLRHWPVLAGLCTYCPICELGMAIVREITKEAR